MRRSHSVTSFNFDPEIERTLRALRRFNRETPINPTTRAMTKLSDEGMPSVEEVPTGTLRTDLTATNFKIDPSFYNLVRKEQFGGAMNEDLAKHINKFCDIYQMIIHESVTQDQLKTMMFPHSLKGKASSWLETLSPALSDTWPTLVLAFYRKFFPPERTANLRMQITGCRQRLNETLYDAWERFKLLEKQCPHHGFGKGFIAMTFYNALNPDSRRILDSAANGRFDSVEVNNARDLIEEMASHSIQYVQSSYTTVGAIGREAIFQQSMASQIEDLKAQLAILKTNSSNPSTTQKVAAVQHHTDRWSPSPIGAVCSPPIVVYAHCDNCDIYGHLSYSCQGTQEQVAAFQGYKDKVPYNNFNSNYNSPYKQHYHQYNNPPQMSNMPSSSTPPYVHPNKYNTPPPKPHCTLYYLFVVLIS